MRMRHFDYGSWVVVAIASLLTCSRAGVPIAGRRETIGVTGQSLTSSQVFKDVGESFIVVPKNVGDGWGLETHYPYQGERQSPAAPFTGINSSPAFTPEQAGGEPLSLVQNPATLPNSMMISSTEFAPTSPPLSENCDESQLLADSMTDDDEELVLKASGEDSDDHSTIEDSDEEVASVRRQTALVGRGLFGVVAIALALTAVVSPELFSEYFAAHEPFATLGECIQTVCPGTGSCLRYCQSLIG